MMPILAVSYEVGNDVILGALLVGLIIFSGGLIAAMNVIKGWIREVAGVKETSTTEISGQPIQVELAKSFTTRDSFHKHAELNRLHHERIEGHVRELAAKLESDKEKMQAAASVRENDLRRRIDAIPHEVIALLKDTKGLIE